MKSTRTITRRFTDQDKANKFYLSLCEQYEYVRLIKSPVLGESGIYSWAVAD